MSVIEGLLCVGLLAIFGLLSAVNHRLHRAERRRARLLWSDVDDLEAGRRASALDSSLASSSDRAGRRDWDTGLAELRREVDGAGGAGKRPGEAAS